MDGCEAGQSAMIYTSVGMTCGISFLGDCVPGEVTATEGTPRFRVIQVITSGGSDGCSCPRMITSHHINQITMLPIRSCRLALHFLFECILSLSIY